MSQEPWIDAIRRIHECREAVVLCPNCLQQPLSVRDLEPELDSSVFERVLHCPGCRASVAARISKGLTEYKPSGETSASADFAARVDERCFSDE